MLRKSGSSIKEIASKLNIAQSTSSVWLREIILSSKAQNRLRKRRILGQYKSMQIAKQKRQKKLKEFERRALKTVNSIKPNINYYKILCAILLWSEGEKYTTSHVGFINSDPNLIKFFITLLRAAFLLEESKFRAMIHIHEYHNEKAIKKFWSDLTKIPLSQFSKSYHKANTKTRLRENYKGTLRIRYYDYKVALELHSIYNRLGQS